MKYDGSSNVHTSSNLIGQYGTMVTQSSSTRTSIESPDGNQYASFNSAGDINIVDTSGSGKPATAIPDENDSTMGSRRRHTPTQGQMAFVNIA